MFCLRVKETLTLEQLTRISMGIFLLRYCTDAHMLHSYRDSITGQLQNILERVLHIDAGLRRNKSKVLTEMTSREH